MGTFVADTGYWSIDNATLDIHADVLITDAHDRGHHRPQAIPASLAAERSSNVSTATRSPSNQQPPN